jgi:signal transduction histidine kinase
VTASRTIQSLDEIVWAINPKHDTLESLANYLSRFAQEFLSVAGIRCVLDVPTVLPTVPLSAEVRHNLVLTAREALQNAATHASATEVRVGLQWSGDELQIGISDDGKGFDPARIEVPGNGLANMRRRLQDVGGTLEIISKPGAGTTVQLKLASVRLHGRVVGRAGEPI